MPSAIDASLICEDACRRPVEAVHLRLGMARPDLPNLRKNPSIPQPTTYPYPVKKLTKRPRFFVGDKIPTVVPQGRPVFLLRADNWDDFGFKTMYDVSLRTADGEGIELGQVKMLERGQRSGRPNLPSTFQKLTSEFCSLGQDIEYYETLMNLPPEIRESYLVALRDAAYAPPIEQEFSNEPGWETSLLRFGQALNALSSGRELIRGNQLSTERLSFQFEWRREDAVTKMPFKFDDSEEIPGRCHVLIGYNGVGKTTLLADLALAASSGRDARAAQKDRSVISGEDQTFGAVIAVSYSAFDTFQIPDTTSRSKDSLELSPRPESLTAMFGYAYCGLRRQASSKKSKTRVDESFELKSIDEIQAEFANALETAGRRESGGHLVDAFEALSREPSFGNSGVDLATLGSGLDSYGAVDAFAKLSTGHKIVLNIVTQLAANLRTRSLVLIDEPETHLHPPLVAALLRAIQVLLSAHNSFAVVATHSPVVVQEMPSQYVRMLERYGNSVNLRSPEIETFGENIGSITRHVFSLDSSSTDYQGVLASLAKDYAIDQIANLFANGLSVQGRALVTNYRELP